MTHPSTHLKYPQQDDIRIAIVGDLHTYWDDVDLIQFADSHYDLLFFTGDLGGGTAGSSLQVAKRISRLRSPTLVMPGNNDTHDIAALGSEFALQNGLAMLSQLERIGSLDHELLSLVGYSNHRLTSRSQDVTLIAARPHSMGGQLLSFPERLLEAYGIENLDQSIERLKQLIDACQTEHIVFLGHNGPYGLGDNPDDIWGCDFKTDGGDWGDPDLAAAIAYAKAQGKQVLAVIAGHMHLHTKCGRQRPWLFEKDHVKYINAARVPRIFSQQQATFRHHIELVLSEHQVSIREMHIAE